MMHLKISRAILATTLIVTYDSLLISQSAPKFDFKLTLKKICSLKVISYSEKL